MAFANRLQVSSLIFLLCVGQALAGELRDQVAKEIDDGSIIQRKPSLRDSKDALIIDLGACNVLGLGNNNRSLLSPLQHQLQISTLREFAFTSDIDRAAIEPFFTQIDHEIDLQLAAINTETDVEQLRAMLKEQDQKIIDLRGLAFESVAKARGRTRVYIEKAAHPGWTVTFVAPAKSLMRFTPLLNYLLNAKTPEKIDWITVQPGDQHTLRGRYRVELIQGETIIEFREPSVRTNYKIRFE